ncbi:hypothetical protein Ancab_009977 [Ancistrocladus abbreviatus]
MDPIPDQFSMSKMENNTFQLDWLYFDEQLQWLVDLLLPLPEPSLEPFSLSSFCADYSDPPPLFPPPFAQVHDDYQLIINGLDHDLLLAADHLNWLNDLDDHHQNPLLSYEPHQALLLHDSKNHPVNIDDQFCGPHMIFHNTDPNPMSVMVDLAYNEHVHSSNTIIGGGGSDSSVNIAAGFDSLAVKEEDMDHVVVGGGMNLHNTAAAVGVLEDHYHKVEFMRDNGDEARSGSGGVGGGKKTKVENLEYEEIAKCFEMPISNAAKKLNIGLTLLKKRCRELKIRRWPHRKLKSLKSLVRNVKELGLVEEVEMLEEHRRMVRKLPQMELTERTKKLRQACFKANYKKRRARTP